MGLLESITTWFRREKADVAESLGELEQKLDADLARKERELAASPEERLDMIQDEIVDDPFAEIRERIERTTHRGDAEAEVDALDRPADDQG
jgi:hypothetical protein